MSALPTTRLHAVRIVRGLTQTRVSEATFDSQPRRGISQSVLSQLETGRLPLDGERATLLARVLDVPVDAISGSAPPVHIAHRLGTSLPAAEVNMTVARFIVETSRAEREDAHASDDIPRPSTDHEAELVASDEARRLRRKWGLPPGPILGLEDLLVHRGALIIKRDLRPMKTVALGSAPRGSRAVFQIEKAATALEARWSLAHELGHAVMHLRPAKEHEIAADLFATELLFPHADTRELLAEIDLSHLRRLEADWGVPAWAIARRAQAAGALTGTRLRQLRAELIR